MNIHSTSESMETIFSKYETDKASSHHNFTRQYNELFRRFRELENVRYLEIGVFHGGSLLGMKEYLHPSAIVVGIDINVECIKYQNAEQNIFIEIGDATNPQFLHSVQEKFGPFDIIIDDGSHFNHDVIVSFENLFPVMKEDGIYVVEDINVYKVPGFQNLKYPNQLQYFLNFTLFLNQSRFDSNVTSTNMIQDFCSDPFKIQKKTSHPIELSLDKLEFGCGYIAALKKMRWHWFP